ncbi:hypothetical protein AGDE_15057 [Angomonas deanei]|uniref:Uncharacterized protein n=1 Tax=Angomonas deanei TaxID=59799 RepID=A0A7G2C4R2_9TRYP|nr:hypothetical protein AGDE_15057 [Angomonas deanei]CAD2214191.1 hypothetical protein, conserved [Angomonas deanei]|eukprot:EPY19756.1 hypothetical protein AGDE_15057 [Angomonas deanei]
MSQLTKETPFYEKWWDGTVSALSSLFKKTESATKSTFAVVKDKTTAVANKSTEAVKKIVKGAPPPPPPPAKRSLSNAQIAGIGVGVLIVLQVVAVVIVKKLNSEKKPKKAAGEE